MLVGGLIGDALTAIALFGTISALMWAIYLFWLLNISGSSIARSAMIFGKTLLGSLPYTLPVAACMALGVPDVVTVGAALICVLASTMTLVERKVQEN